MMPSGTRRVAQGNAGSAISGPTGGNPPASTFAAQIVQNLTQGHYSTKQPDKEEFQRLLQEILHPDEDGDDAGDAMETNVDVNCRLIYVVVRAGLESLSNQDFFGDQDELHKQAIASLSVVELTMRQSPSVLFYSFQGAQQVGPLYLWLLPRLFMLVGISNENDIRRYVCGALQAALLAEKTTYKQTKFLLIQKYLQGCIKGQQGSNDL